MNASFWQDAHARCGIVILLCRVHVTQLKIIRRTASQHEKIQNSWRRVAIINFSPAHRKPSRETLDDDFTEASKTTRNLDFSLSRFTAAWCGIKSRVSGDLHVTQRQILVHKGPIRLIQLRVFLKTRFQIKETFHYLWPRFSEITWQRVCCECWRRCSITVVPGENTARLRR